MNDSERLVREYLMRQGFSDVVYEPDGNVPPDFLVDGRIAVEVRRLNQNDETPEGPRGLEEVAFPLHAAVEKVLASMGPPTAGVSWFVSYSFRRPLRPWKELERALTVALTNFKNQSSHQPANLRIADRFRLQIMRAGKPHPTFFVLGGSIDCDSGGFVVAELERNLRICVAEKTKKVAPVGNKYPEWWLALVDRIGYGLLDEFDREQLQELVPSHGRWDRIILVNPVDPARGFDL